MSAQEISSSTPRPDQETLAAYADQRQDILSGDVFIEGTIITSAIDPQGDPTTTSTQDRSVSSATSTSVRPTLAQFILGSVLVLTDEMGDRIVVEQAELPGTTRTPESVYRPVSEFDEMLGGEQYRQTRYLALGVADETLKAAGRGVGWVGDTADSAGKFVWRFAGPVWNSTLLGPVRHPVERWQERGEEQVQTWIRNGMVQEQRSRVLATASLNNLVQESVSDITNNEEVQVLVQEVIQSQSISMVTVIMQEIRERLISLDIWAQGVFGTAMPAPLPARENYLQRRVQRRPQLNLAELDNSMAGYAAGFVTRFAAFAIDVNLLLLSYTISSAALTGTLNLFGLTDLVSRFLTSGTLIANLALVLLGMATFLLLSSYAVLSWYMVGETIGDAIVGVQVVDPAGGPLTFWRSVRRLFGVYVSAIPFFIGFIWILFDKNRRGWHDRIGGTYVVYDWPARPEETFLNTSVTEQLTRDAQQSRSNAAR